MQVCTRTPLALCPIKVLALGSNLPAVVNNSMSGAILPFTEANSKRVASLFRKALRTAYDSSLKFDAYRRETINIRAQFDSNKHIEDPNELEEVLASAKAKLAEYAHPDPYIPPSRPGGTKYERNVPLAKEPVITGDW